jgi:hypothetical protein
MQSIPRIDGIVPDVLHRGQRRDLAAHRALGHETAVVGEYKVQRGGSKQNRQTSGDAKKQGLPGLRTMKESGSPAADRPQPLSLRPLQDDDSDHRCADDEMKEQYGIRHLTTPVNRPFTLSQALPTAQGSFTLRTAEKSLSGRRTNDGGKRLRVETGPPNQRAIDLGLPQKLPYVLGLDAAAV